MEIVRSNFDEHLQEIYDAIDEASFIAIDTEFTGKSLPGYISRKASVDKYYEEVRNKAKNFQLVQFGLTTFTYDEARNRFTVKPFNFYLFPLQFNKGYDRRFMCQSSSIHFLSTQNFDFNKWVYEGVPYMQHEAEERLREDLEEKYEPKDRPKVTQEERDFIQYNGIREQIDSFIYDEEESYTVLDPCLSSTQQMWVHKLVMTDPDYRNNVVLETLHEDNETFLKVWFIDDSNERQRKIAKIKRVESEELDKAVGFTKILKKVASSGKLVVGHNMNLDLLHTVSHFFCSLPKSLRDFTECAKSVFPKTIDTKYMAMSEEFHDTIDSTRLEDLWDVLSRRPFRRPAYVIAEGFERYSRKTLHEAGYDAFLTGLCFIGMVNALDPLDGMRRFTPISRATESFIGKIFLPLENNGCLNLHQRGTSGSRGTSSTSRARVAPTPKRR